VGSVPSRLVIRLTVDDEPLPGVFAIVTLPMWSKNQYALPFGPSDERGVISVSGDDLMRGAATIQDLSPMDYASFPAEWSGGIGAEIVDAFSVQRIRDAIGLWGGDHLPGGIRDDLDGYEARMKMLSQRQLLAEVAHTG
jgi:hypothetical protein